MALLETVLDDVIDLLARRRELPSSGYSFVVSTEESIIHRRLLARRFPNFIAVGLQAIIIALKRLVLVLALLIAIVI